MIAASTNPVPLLPSPPQSRSLPSPRYPVFAASTSIVVAAAALAAADRTVVIKRPARHRLTLSLTVSTVVAYGWVGCNARTGSGARGRNSRGAPVPLTHLGVSRRRASGPTTQCDRTRVTLPTGPSLPDTQHLRADKNTVRARSAAALGGARVCAGLAFIVMKSAKAVEDVADDDDKVQ